MVYDVVYNKYSISLKYISGSSKRYMEIPCLRRRQDGMFYADYNYPEAVQQILQQHSYPKPVLLDYILLCVNEPCLTHEDAELLYALEKRTNKEL